MIGLEMLYCIEHDEFHVYDETGMFLDVEWCDGPFTTSPPPELNESVWDIIFANEPDEEFLLTWDVCYG